MRIAICISGFLRTWEYTKKTFLEQLVDGVEYDLFVHTYYQNFYEMTAERKDVKLTIEEIRKQFDGFNLKVLAIEDREEILPKIFEVTEKYKNVLNYSPLQLESSDPNSKSIPIGIRIYDQLRKIHLCNELRKSYETLHNKKYDLVIKTRFDLAYFCKPDWNKCFDNKVHFEYGATFGWPNDTFCACIPEIMDKAYANRFLFLDEMFFYPKVIKPGLGLCAHGSLGYILDREKIKIGDPVINTNCFRSHNSFQYYENYFKKYELEELYSKLKIINTKNPYEIESRKKEILK